jgi:Xaa-Pro aminopeptidase
VGVRIEDDVLVTESGYENLTVAVPKQIEDVEALCRGA